MHDTPYLVIAGPTGSGKSALALSLAQRLGGELISCDSVQIYRGFDLGAAKPTREEQRLVPHHLLNVASWDQDFDAARFAEAAGVALAAVRARGRLPIVVGGTGLYLRALLGHGWHKNLPQDAALREQHAAQPTAELYAELARLDPRRAAAVHPNDRVRVARSLELVTLLGMPLHAAGIDFKFNPHAAVAELNPVGSVNVTSPAPVAPHITVLMPERAALHKRIELRTAAMLAQGLIAEVERLLAAGVSPTCKPMQSIGYKQVTAYLAGELARPDLPLAIMAATRQYAKRQCTWFKKLENAEHVSEANPEVLAQWWEKRLRACH